MCPPRSKYRIWQSKHLNSKKGGQSLNQYYYKIIKKISISMNYLQKINSQASKTAWKYAFHFGLLYGTVAVSYRLYQWYSDSKERHRSLKTINLKAYQGSKAQRPSWAVVVYYDDSNGESSRLEELVAQLQLDGFNIWILTAQSNEQIVDNIRTQCHEAQRTGGPQEELLSIRVDYDLFKGAASRPEYDEIYEEMSELESDVLVFMGSDRRIDVDVQVGDEGYQGEIDYIMSLGYVAPMVLHMFAKVNFVDPELEEGQEDADNNQDSSNSNRTTSGICNRKLVMIYESASNKLFNESLNVLLKGVVPELSLKQVKFDLKRVITN